MKRDSELQDNVARIYRQSLLYFVRNACESDCGPILGLEESIREDTELVKLFRYEQAPSDLANLVLSPRLGGVRKREQASATAHGAFDEDVPTMNSVMRRILELADDQLLPRSLDGRTDSRSAPRDGRFADSRVLQFRAIGSRGSAAEERGTGRVLALCIGIDTYADSPLQGCVADSRLWAATLEARGVIVHRTLFNEQATKRAIVDAWRRVSEGARPEDTIVIQFAGHGTFVSDKNGDESDGNDEAWVAFDYGSGGLLIDDEIGALIDGATLRRAARCVLLTDCCHSGTGTRARSMLPVAAKNSRFLPLAQNSAAMRAFERTYQDWRLELGIGSRGIDTLGREIHFAGCQDYQSSYESNGHGAFTLAATRALKGLKTGATYADWARAIAHAFDGNAQQRPNFRAPPDGARSLVLASRGRPAEIDPDTGELSSTSHGSAGLSAMQTPISQATVTALSERIDELEDEVRALRLTFEARQD